MRLQRGMPDPPASELCEISDVITDRVELSGDPDESVVSHFVMTRGAERAWTAINQQLSEPRGALFLIEGPGGTGKTHFLNYVIALSQRAGELGAEPGRRLTLGLAPDPASVQLVDFQIAELIDRHLEKARRPRSVWHQLSGADALRVMLDQAKRLGIRALTIAIDLGDSDSVAMSGPLKALAALAAATRQPQLTILVAARLIDQIPGALEFAVGARADEAAAAALGRARRLLQPASAAIFQAYEGLELGGFDLARIFPFHPITVSRLMELWEGDRNLAAAARAAQAMLLGWRDRPPPRGLIWPSALMNSPGARETLEARLGESGRAALAIEQAAAEAMGGRPGLLAHEIAELLALQYLADGGAACNLEQLRSQLSPGIDRVENHSDAVPDALAELAVRSRGVILLDPQTAVARFNPHAAGAPEIAAYNAALPLSRRFDAALTQVSEPGELQAGMQRLRIAMAAALERASHDRAVLTQMAREAGAVLREERQRIFERFIAIAQGGPQELMALAADPSGRERGARTLADYEVLAALAAAVPRLNQMREYLQAMGLHETLEDDPDSSGAVARIETECKLLLVAVNAAVQAKSPAVLDALESRFQRFKWTYVPLYRAAHQKWRTEMERAAVIVGEGARHLAALKRLNAIGALGPPADDDLGVQFEELAKRVTRCNLDLQLSPEITPRCPSCSYVIGTPPPVEALTELVARARRAIEAKLAILSQSAIARLIEEHDESGRLDGFLRIIQAAQTDALIRVLDDTLAHYLGRLLDENLADNSGRRAGRLVRSLRPARLVGRGPGKDPRGGRKS